MNYTALKEQVCRINKEIVRAGLVTLTFGNASGADRRAGVMAIKPSGVGYDDLTPADIVVLDLGTGKVIEGAKRPSSDTPTHLHLYRHFPNVAGIIHTHSTHATSWAQAGRAIPCLGTTHTDHFHGPVPVTRQLTRQEIESDYELNTGRVIVETCRQPDEIPAVLVAGHAPFAWGATPEKALENAIALECVAELAGLTLALNPKAKPLPRPLLAKHSTANTAPAPTTANPDCARFQAVGFIQQVLLKTDKFRPRPVGADGRRWRRGTGNGAPPLQSPCTRADIIHAAARDQV